jgi:cytochrome c oxidase cbb3-type subunit III
MKFSTYLETITGVSIYPLISLILFVVFFILVTIWVYSIDKTEIQRIENLPLEKNDLTTHNF